MQSAAANYWSFNLFEVCCGLYFPVSLVKGPTNTFPTLSLIQAIGTLRGRYVPEETRATVMNIFRVPLNLIVVSILVKVIQHFFKLRLLAST